MTTYDVSARRLLLAKHNKFELLVQVRLYGLA